MSNTYKDYWLKFPDKAAWEAMKDDAPEGYVYGGGTITWRPEVDDEGNVVVQGETRPGWHVNIRTKGELPEALVPYSIPKPERPKWELQ